MLYILICSILVVAICLFFSVTMLNILENDVKSVYDTHKNGHFIKLKHPRLSICPHACLSVIPITVIVMIFIIVVDLLIIYLTVRQA